MKYGAQLDKSEKKERRKKQHTHTHTKGEKRSGDIAEEKSR